MAKHHGPADGHVARPRDSILRAALRRGLLGLLACLFDLSRTLVSLALTSVASLVIAGFAVRMLCQYEAHIPAEVSSFFPVTTCPSKVATPGVSRQEVIEQVESRLLRASQDYLGYRD